MKALRWTAIALAAGSACVAVKTVSAAPAPTPTPAPKPALSPSLKVDAVALAAPAWKEGVSYSVGQRVSYLGLEYICIQAHTAWVGANWNPKDTSSLWRLVS